MCKQYLIKKFKRKKDEIVVLKIPKCIPSKIWFNHNALMDYDFLYNKL